MKKTIVSFLAVAMSISTGFSQSSVWEVSKNDNTLFLGGSVHLLRAEDYPLPAAFDKAFNQSDVLVLEANVAQLADPEVAQAMMAQAMLPGEETLQTVLNEETFGLLKVKCDEISFPLENAMKFKPAMIATILTAIKMQQMAFTPAGVDMHYDAKAKERNMRIDFLETLDFQMNLLVNMGAGYENEFVKYSIDELDNIQTSMDRLISEWRDGTSEFLSSMLIEMKQKFPTVHKSMFTDRENEWLPKIEEYLTGEPIEFIVVGLAHLHGEEGLLAQLQSKGYRVKQVE